MATGNVTEEIENIRKSLESLESQVTQEGRTVTAGSEGDYLDIGRSEGTGQDNLRNSREYLHLIVDAAISKTELNQERKITQAQKEILGEIGNLSKEIQDNKPNYFWLFVSVFLASILTLAAIFVPVIPVYTENIVNSKLEEKKKTILEEVEKFVKEQIAAASTVKTAAQKK